MRTCGNSMFDYWSRSQNRVASQRSLSWTRDIGKNELNFLWRHLATVGHGSDRRRKETAWCELGPFEYHSWFIQRWRLPSRLPIGDIRATHDKNATHNLMQRMVSSLLFKVTVYHLPIIDSIFLKAKTAPRSPVITHVLYANWPQIDLWARLK